jgi:hypothetical protein
MKVCIKRPAGARLQKYAAEKIIERMYDIEQLHARSMDGDGVGTESRPKTR